MSSLQMLGAPYHCPKINRKLYSSHQFQTSHVRPHHYKDGGGCNEQNPTAPSSNCGVVSTVQCLQENTKRLDLTVIRMVRGGKHQTATET